MGIESAAHERPGEDRCSGGCGRSTTPRSTSATGCAARSRRSFPSGHATAAFCAATLLGGGVGWYTLAAAVAATRVYVRLHHASDVVAGAAFGSRSRARAASDRIVRVGHDGRDQEVPPMTQPLRREFRLPVPLRPQRARGGRDRVARGTRLGRALPRRSRSTRCTSSEGEPPVWERPPAECGHRRARARVGHRRARRLPRPLPRLARRAVRGPPRPGRRRSRRKRCCARRSRRRSGSTPMRSRPKSRAGRPLKTLAAEHTEAVKRWAMFGVPTFVVGDRAVFVALDGARPARRHRPGARPVRVRPASTSSSTRASRA